MRRKVVPDKGSLNNEPKSQNFYPAQENSPPPPPPPPHLNATDEYKMECTQRDRMTDMVTLTGFLSKTQKAGNLENNPFL